MSIATIASLLFLVCYIIPGCILYLFGGSDV